MADHPIEVDWFASREEESYRDEARNILDSYAHPWDILAELAQNAVDAIDVKRQGDKSHNGKIFITVNQINRSIEIRDNGVGISEEDLKRVLKPHFSRKRNSRALRGEKGVGLTYIALTGNSFQLVTRINSQTRKLTVCGSQDWMQGRGTHPQLRIEPIQDESKDQSYTIVTVSGIPQPSADSDDLDIFTLNFDQLQYLLRTRTAIGWTGKLFGLAPTVSMKVTLSLQSVSGEAVTKAIEYSYATPQEDLPAKNVLELATVKEYLSELKENKVFGKAIYLTQTKVTTNKKPVRLYCLLMSRNSYAQQNEAIGVPEELAIQGGLYVATKGMPTGITLSAPKTGGAGYWPNIYMVVEYDEINLDLGRKSITAPRVVAMLRNKAADLFNEVAKYIKYTIREEEGALDALVSQNELQDELADVKKEGEVTYETNLEARPLPQRYPLIRAPKQEQDVVVLFAMCLARNLFPYEILRVSSTYRYDCFLRYIHDRKPLYVVAEFKLVGESILDDFKDAKARYGQLHLLVCWSLDEAKLRNKGFILEAIAGGKNEFPGATHKMSFPSSANIKDQPISVICLSKHLPLA